MSQETHPLDPARSAALFERARSLMPGGVNSPVRAFGAVGGTPRFIAAGFGPRMTDVDGREYIDYVGSWGPLILGHAHPAVVEALREAAARGTSFGAPCQAEVEMAELVCECVPSVEVVRMVNSGTEAAMSAIRLARAATGRSKIVKMDGCYHGHADALLVKAGSGVATFGLPDSPGVTPGAAADTLTVPYNDAAAVAQLLQSDGKNIAAVILEPVAGNMGLVPPAPDYLETLRALTAKHGVLLIFDEVMSGFRVALGGAQALYGVTPDLTVLGKVIGGGLPVAAYGGRRDLMARIAPSGPVYQAGTLSGNPLAMAAGLATLRLLRAPGFYERLEATSRSLCEGLHNLAREAAVPIWQNRVGSMLGLFFQDGPVANYEQAARSDKARYARWFHGMLAAGVYFPPSQFETFFVGAAHGPAEVDATLDDARRVFAALA
jgi:glutamate-1-semialdehyde 2,1-aminomutase